MAALWEFVRKDLLVFRSDRGAAITSIAMPVMLALFLGGLMGGASGDGQKMKPVPVVIADQDDSPTTQLALKEMTAESHLTVTKMSAADAREAVSGGKTALAVVVPKGFGAATVAAMVGGGAKPKLEEFLDPAQQTASMAAQGFVTKAFATAALHDAFGERKEGGDMLPFEAVATQAAAKTTNDGEAQRAHIFAGMAVQGVLFMAVNLALGVMRERRTGVWRRVRTAPPSLAIQVFSRLLSGTIIGCLSFTCVFAVGLLTGLHIHGSALALAVQVISCSAMASGVGLAIASFGKTEEQSRGLSVLFVLTMTMLSGAWFPSFLMPEWVQKATLVVPARWAVDGLDGAMWRDIGTPAVLTAAGVTATFAATFFGFALWRFRALEKAA